jgi:hypothetical protein
VERQTQRGGRDPTGSGKGEVVELQAPCNGRPEPRQRTERIDNSKSSTKVRLHSDIQPLSSSPLLTPPLLLPALWQTQPMLFCGGFKAVPEGVESWLSVLLLVKIGGTGLLFALPALALPAHKFPSLLGTPAPGPLTVFVRLLGWAWVSLLVGYWGGMQLLGAGIFPTYPLCMGVVSNGGAGVLILGWLAKGGKSKSWSKQGRAIMLFGAVFVLGVTGALIVALKAQFAQYGCL